VLVGWAHGRNCAMRYSPYLGSVGKEQRLPVAAEHTLRVLQCACFILCFLVAALVRIVKREPQVCGVAAELLPGHCLAAAWLCGC
jgi:hypothetical protein